MTANRLRQVAKDDLIRIHHYGIEKFERSQADEYIDQFFQYFDTIMQRPYSFESVGYIRPGYRRCPCGSDSIYYRLGKDDIIEIMAIVGRQDLDQVFG